MKEIFGQLGSYDEAPWAKAPKAYQNIVHEDENVIVYKDGFPVTEGHLLFVPKKENDNQILQGVLNLHTNGVCVVYVNMNGKHLT